MHQTLLRVCVVAFSLLIYPRDNPGLEEKDEIISLTHKDKVKEVMEEVSHDLCEAPRWSKRLKQILETKEKRSATENLTRRDEEISENQTKVKREEEVNEEEQMYQSSEAWDKELLWFVWNMFSLVSMLNFLRKFLQNKSTPEIRLPDSDTLLRFYSKHLHGQNRWEEEFLDGFANDLLTSAREVCETRGGMTVQDFKTSGLSEITVPLIPPEPYKIQCQLRKDETTKQLCGQVQLVDQSTCPCQSPGAGEDMVCLLHCGAAEEKTDSFAQLCVNNSSFLSKTQMLRWFRGTLKEAWTKISHKYDFKVTVNRLDARCSLVVQFKSGRKLCLKLNPVVTLNCYTHLCVTSSPGCSDSHWPLSLEAYDDDVLHCISQRLPRESCHTQVLEIARFLHHRQVAITGACALTDQRLKTALIHILIRTKPAQWESNQIGSRFRDLLLFVGKSLLTKSLHHALDRNSVSELPAEVRSVNLFRPLVAQECIYRHTLAHYREILHSAHMLIQDYMGET